MSNRDRLGAFVVALSSRDILAGMQAQHAINTLLTQLDMATVFQVGRFRMGNTAEPITVCRCEGYRLPRQPYMWAVRWLGNVLCKDGEWEYEPTPSSRDDEFYARARFDTYEEAMEAAQKALAAEATA